MTGTSTTPRPGTTLHPDTTPEIDVTTATHTTTARAGARRGAAGFSSAALVTLEIKRSLRNRKFLFFSVLFPALLFLITAGGQDADATMPGSGGLSVPAYLMVSMASFGALTAVLMGNSERIAQERENGWVRQLRLTSLPGRGYVLAKTGSAAVVSLPSIVVVFVAGAVVKGVRLDAWQWLALTGSIWAGSLCFAALGVAVGYLATSDTARPIAMILYFTLSVLGGLWMPSTTFPHWLQTVGEWLPTHAYAALGRAIELGGAPHAKDVVLLGAYFAAFAAGAAWLYRKDTLKA
ncbi:ABC transporter permease [Streptomyces spectabilis]|uniref:ABC transporter permease n=1 Tax=Streptomyces spectabilis TaxID=68270 RepID=A0A5P2XG29_STRST|nr:ABC transporter permease [Streptomyces spectabilis]MBB5104746.1 ABC-2 type transport system permease protein [Streptomyces spectabilis]MCI3904901.1 ABC transporter permease [Streptomyces spectabilis]QEV61940.1 ABC transporter permease [Streptomyces spectabilis]GGV01922.1 ABC transporter [Streptomyces spectabilis]